MERASPGGPDEQDEDIAISAEEIYDLLASPGRVALETQPIVDLRRAEIVGYEVLTRFMLSDGRFVSPLDIFSAADAIGIGGEIEAAVLERAFVLARRKPPNCFLSINIDPLHLDEPPVVDAIAAYGDLADIVFELTEHDTTVDLDTIRPSIDVLRRSGALIAIDDSGVGYAGLKEIVALQPQFVKLKRDLVADAHKNEAKRALISFLGELAGRLDAWVIAEGIERDAELASIVQLGVPLGQGDGLARAGRPWPVLPPDVAARVKSHTKPADQAVGSGSLVVLVEPAAVARGDDDWPSEPIAIRVDQAGRPIEMRISTDEEYHLRMEYELMRVKRDASAAEVAIRAMTRPDRLRWDPIVCIDDLGNIDGIIPLQRLVTAVAHSAEHSSRPVTTVRR